MPPAASPAGVAVLMYHSISELAGPTAISPALFAGQMQALQDLGWHVADLSEFVAWRKGEQELPARTAVITFDDAFVDFEENAAPELIARGWNATVFVPTKCAGRRVDWGGVGESQLVLDWPAMRALAEAGIRFGSHAETHGNLAKMDAGSALEELVRSKMKLERELGEAISHFAAPYGATDGALRAAIAQHYASNVGVRLDCANRTANLYDIPRIEMHYFRSLKRWRGFLDGDSAYLGVRKALRAAKSIVSSAGRAWGLQP